MGDEKIHPNTYQLRRQSRKSFGVSICIPTVDEDVRSRGIAEVAQPLLEEHESVLMGVAGARGEKADPPHLPGRLRLGNWRQDADGSHNHGEERTPVERRPARITSLRGLNPRDCDAAPNDRVGHSITWSARWSSAGGIVSPRAFAVFRLITSSNFVGCSNGRSPGLAPLRIRSTWTAACRYISARLAP